LEKKLHRLQAALTPFHYTSRGAMAYIGHEKAIIQLPFSEMELSAGGVLTGLAVSASGCRV
jgi:NADH dehydrogenase FAD-containing subunit